MGRLEEAKTLGGIGSILELIPGVSLVGFILTLIAVKYISDSLQDKTIFDNMLYAVIAAIAGFGIFFGILFSGLFFALFSIRAGVFLLVFGLLAVIWVALIVAAIFLKKSYDTIAEKLRIDAFRTTGMLYFIGAILTILFGIGLIIIFIASIFQIVAFFSIKETSQPYSSWQSGQPGPPAPAASQPTQQTGQSTKFCQYCGAPVLDVQARFCKSCGKPLAQV